MKDFSPVRVHQFVLHAVQAASAMSRVLHNVNHVVPEHSITLINPLFVVPVQEDHIRNLKLRLHVIHARRENSLIVRVMLFVKIALLGDIKRVQVPPPSALLVKRANHRTRLARLAAKTAPLVVMSLTYSVPVAYSAILVNIKVLKVNLSVSLVLEDSFQIEKPTIALLANLGNLQIRSLRKYALHVLQVGFLLDSEPYCARNALQVVIKIVKVKQVVKIVFLVDFKMPLVPTVARFVQLVVSKIRMEL